MNRLLLMHGYCPCDGIYLDNSPLFMDICKHNSNTVKPWYDTGLYWIVIGLVLNKTSPGQEQDTMRSWSSLWSSAKFVRHFSSWSHNAPEAKGAKQLGLWALELWLLHWQGPESFFWRSDQSSGFFRLVASELALFGPYPEPKETKQIAISKTVWNALKH